MKSFGLEMIQVVHNLFNESLDKNSISYLNQINRIKALGE